MFKRFRKKTLSDDSESGISGKSAVSNYELVTGMFSKNKNQSVPVYILNSANELKNCSITGAVYFFIKGSVRFILSNPISNDAKVEIGYNAFNYVVVLEDNLLYNVKRSNLVKDGSITIMNPFFRSENEKVIVCEFESFLTKGVFNSLPSNLKGTVRGVKIPEFYQDWVHEGNQRFGR